MWSPKVPKISSFPSPWLKAIEQNNAYLHSPPPPHTFKQKGTIFSPSTLPPHEVSETVSYCVIRIVSAIAVLTDV